MAKQPSQLRRYQQRERAAAVRRVKRFRAWLKAGSDLRTIPVVPTDNDYDIAREKGVIA